MSFFNSIKLLLPKSKAFNITQNSLLRKFFEGISELPEFVKHDNELMYFDIWPDTTRMFEEWEKQFGISFSDEKYRSLRSELLKTLWRINIGGQSLTYITKLLQTFIPELNVYENVPVKNPRDSNAVYVCMCGQQNSVCGNKKMSCGYLEGESSFVPSVIRNDKDNLYDIPAEVDYWVNYFFVAKNLVRNSKNEIVVCEKLIVDSKWKPFIEFVILKTKPVHMGAVLFIEYKDNYDNTRSLKNA